MRPENKNSERREPREVVIEDVGFGGDGVGRVDGRVWFVPFAWIGERVLARPLQWKKEFVRAELVEVLEGSADRVTPRCRYFGACGGCSYQHVNYPAQLHRKAEQVRSLLARIGGISMDSIRMEEVVPAPEPYEYRNRITVHIQNGVTGFHHVHRGHLVDIERCEIARPSVNEALRKFRKKRPFDGHRTLRESKDPPAGFRQTNEAVAALLLEYVQSILGREFHGENSLLIDAYCGAGFFARALQGSFGRVLAVDWSASAIASAREQEAGNVEFLEACVTEALASLPSDSRTSPVWLLLDPPAEGLDVRIIKSILESPLQQIVYVSCNPATFARDAKRLAPAFRLDRLVPFDMFPQTAQIEVVGSFSHREDALPPANLPQVAADGL